MPHPHIMPVPPQPQIFGRNAETEHIVNCLTDHDTAYIAILGGPGMGKTTLAISTLYHASVRERNFQPGSSLLPVML